MSIPAQQRLAMRLTIFMAVAVTSLLLLMGWTLYRPGRGPALPAAVSMGH